MDDFFELVSQFFCNISYFSGMQNDISVSEAIGVQILY